MVERRILLAWAARLGGYNSQSEVHAAGMTVRDSFSYELGGMRWASLSLEMGAPCSDVVSIIVSGPRAAGVANTLHGLVAASSRASTSIVTSCELHGLDGGDEGRLSAVGLLGAARLNIQETAEEGSDQPVLIARLAATFSEDANRLLAHVLAPLGSELGHVPYSASAWMSRSAKPPS